MFRTTAFLAFVAICVTSATAETRKMKLLNPDGTVASDANAIAVLASTGAMVDHELRPLPFHTMNGQRQPSPFKDITNENGTISFDTSAHAVVAQNEQGFIFVPAKAFAESATLRQWAAVDLKTLTFPDKLRDSHRLHISWSNSLAHNGVRGLYPKALDAKPDWRFDSMVSIAHIVPVGDADLKVPPGEVTVTIVEAEQVERVAQDEVDPHHDAAYTSLGFWVTESGRSTEISLPAFGSVVGQIDVDAGLPDWGNSGADYGNVSAGLFDRPSPPSEILRMVQKRFGNRDWARLDESEIPRFLAFLTSEAGIDFRRKTMFRSRATVAMDGKFRLDFMPEGAHRLMWNVRVPGTLLSDSFGNVPSANAVAYSSFNVYSKGKNLMRPVRYIVTAGEVNDVGTLESDAPDTFMRRTPLLSTGRTMLPGLRLGSAVRPVDGQPVQRIVMSSDANPLSLTSPFAPSDVNISQQGTASSAMATTALQRWLQLNARDGGTQRLQKELNQHLVNDFNARQKSREAEIERLQQLINKSKKWLIEREQNRDKIVGKRMAELLKSVEE